MSAPPASPQYFVEVFPIRRESIPPLYAYRLALNNDTPEAVAEARNVGGRLAYRLRQMLPGTWVWESDVLLTEIAADPARLASAVGEIRAERTKAYRLIDQIVPDPNWQPDADALAKFVARGLLPALNPQIEAALAQTSFPLKHARVEREYRALTHNVDDAPALSLSVISRVVYAKPIREYIAAAGKATALIGLWASDVTSRLEGEIVKVVGQLREHRERLLGLAQRDASRAIIEAASDESWVLRLEVGQHEYDYVEDGLQLLVRLEDAARYDVIGAQIEKALHLKPAMRANIVKLVSDIGKGANLIANAYSVQNAPERFSSSERAINLVYGGGRAKPYDMGTTAANAQVYGDYWRPPRFASEPIRVVVINTLQEGTNDFLEALKRAMERDFHISLEIVRERNMRVISQANLDSAVRLIYKETFDLILIFLPDEAGGVEDDGVEARYAKTQTLGRGMACLTLHATTINKPENMPNIILGIMARAGCAPYILEDPITSIPDYADLVIGLDIVPYRYKEQAWLTGMSRIYRTDGALLRAFAATAPAPDGNLPDALLARLLPSAFVENQRVVLHYDGALRREFVRAVGGWEAEVNATFYPVEIIRGGVPRLYALIGGRIDAAPRGTIFRLNEREAFVLTSSAPFDATPQPLHIRADAEVGIENAVRSVLDLTLMQVGALKPTKLPVTTHNADFIAQGIRRGLFPHDLESATPFWL